MATASKLIPINRLRVKGYASHFAPAVVYNFKFTLKNKETVSLKSDGCRECIFKKKPKACVRNIVKNFIHQEPWFRMGSNNGRRNCAVNPKKKISPVKWIPVSQRNIKKTKPTKEAIALWGGLKQYAGQKLPSGLYEITRYIDNKDMFRKAMHFGVIVRDDTTGKWLLAKPDDATTPEQKKKAEKKKLKFEL